MSRPRPTLLRHTFIRVFLASAQVIAAIGTAAMNTPQPVAASTAHNLAAQITGTVFQDYNSNGVMNTTGLAPDLAIDAGVSGVTVSAFVSGSLSAATTATTDASGVYTLTGLTSGAPYRIEFTNLPAGNYPSTHGTDNGTGVQFATAGASNVSLGIQYPGDYCQNNPQVAITCMRVGDQTAANYSLASANAIVLFDSSTSGTSPSLTQAASQVEIGTTYGQAYNRANKQLYTAAYVKRHSGLTSNGAGAIFRTDVANPAAPGTPTLWATVPNIGFTASNATRGLPADIADSTGDALAMSAVGKTGLGDIEVSEDGTTLYAMNLFDKSIYPVSTASGVVGSPIAVPAPACSNGEWRPFALEVYGGRVYAGGICDASSAGATTLDLTAQIYPYDPANGTWGAGLFAGAGFSLDYDGVANDDDKGCAFNSTYGCRWNIWTDTWSPTETANFGSDKYVYRPMPILSDIEFLNTGRVVLALRDRWGDMTGQDQYNPTGNGSLYRGTTGGDLLMAWNNNGSWQTESAGQAGPGYNSSGTGTGNEGPGGPNSDQGPGGGEFFWNDFYSGFATHSETSNGSLVLLPNGIVGATVMDPLNLWSAGVSWFQTTDGSTDHQVELLAGTDSIGSFGKSSGLGDIELLCDSAPIEIGNRVWQDDNANGIQDAGEAGLGGVLVTLQTPTTTLTTTTAADGTYYFNNLQANTAYTLTFPTTQNGLPLTAQNATSDSSNNPLADLSDNDADAAGQIIFSTGNAGENNHTLDVGYGAAAPTPAKFGDRVWIESDADGNANTGTITPLAGMVITATSTNGAIFTTTTDAQGYYSFTVAAGTYTVTYGAVPASYGNVAPSSTPGGNTEAGNAGSFAQTGNPDQSHVNNTAVTVAAGQANWHVDFAFTPAAAQFGDRVWVESDADGNASTGTITPIAGMVITATDGTNTYTTTTDAQGNYSFTVAAGTYTVTYGAVPASYGSVVPSSTPGGNTEAGNAGSFAQTGNPDQSHVNNTAVTVAAGQANWHVDFAFTPADATFGNFVWVESDADGIASTGTITPVAGMVITATDQNGVVYTQTTNTQGYYTFTVPAGVYTVTYGTAPAGTVPSATPNGSTANGTAQGNDQQSRPDQVVVTLVAGDVIPTIDFGFYQTAGLGDFVWDDYNHDGQQDSNEPGIKGVTVTLYANGVPVSSAQTNSSGYYSFTSLAPGVPYSVAFSTPAGYLPTFQNTGNDASDSDADVATGASQTITLSGGEFNPTLDAGFWRPSGLGDYVWQDINHNGVQDAGEPGVPNVVVTLQTPTGTLQTTTNSSGYYSFTNLLPNVPYTVGFTAPTGYTFTLPNIGSDTTDSDANVTTGQTTSVTLQPGEFNPTIDAGLWQPMSLGNYVWIDTNNNGFNDEPASNGVNGVSVNLYADNGNGVLGAGDTLISTTTTTNGGYYLFTNLISGTYLVQIPSGNFNVGAPLFNHSSSTGNGVAATNNNLNNDDDGEPQGATNNIVSRPITLTPGQEPDSTPSPNGNTNLSVDFGFFPYASLGDRVWFDVNANGIQDTNEMTGVAGVPVVLYSALTNQPIATTTTDANGIYSFTQLIPGDYFVQFDLPTGWTRSPQNANGNTDETIDSDADVTTGRTAVTTLVAGENDLTWDAGIYYTASLGDRMWEDLDRNGLQDAGEPGVSGVLVTLFANGRPISTTTTDATGFYQFSSLTPSVPYSVSFALPSGYQFTSSNANNNGNDAADSDVDSNGSTQIVTLAPDEHNPTLDAGIWRPAGIGDRVWLDNDRDGVQGSNEPGVPNVPVTLYQNGVAISQTTTDANGNYSFTGLIPGTYSLTFGLPAGYDRTQQDALGNTSDAADSDTNVTTGATVPTTLTSGEYDSTWDMGLYQLASLGDYVWIDANRNGQQDSGEAPVPNVRVVLHDATGTAILTITTDSNGFYNFTNLQPGNYTVQFDLSTLPANYVPTTQGPNGSSDATDSDADATGQTELITLSAGENDTTWDMGIYLPTAGLGDYVWLDRNLDGQQQSGEPALTGITVTLYANGVPISTTTTNASGYYSFTSLLPGVAYTLQFSLPPGFEWTRPVQGAPATDSNANGNGQTSPVTLVPDEFNPTIDAGLVPVLTLEKDGVGSGEGGLIGKDGLITYSLTIRNDGTQPVNSLAVSDALPSNLSYLRAIGTAPNSTNPLYWNLSSMQPGEVRTLSFVALVKSEATSVENVASLLIALPGGPSSILIGTATANTQRGPTAVTLLAFTAAATSNGVQVAWQTGAEINTFGFALYRSATQDRAAAVLVTQQMIAAHGAGDYSFNDATATVGQTYHYWLVEAETDGTLLEYGPASVMPATQSNANTNTTISTQAAAPSAVATAGGVVVAAGANVAAAPVVAAVPVAVSPANSQGEQSQVAVTANTVPATAAAATVNEPQSAVADPVAAQPATTDSVMPVQPVNATAVPAVPAEQAKPAATVNTVAPGAASSTEGTSAAVASNSAPAAQTVAQVVAVRNAPAAQPQVHKLSPVLLAAGIAGVFVTLCLIGLGGLAFILSRKRRS